MSWLYVPGLGCSQRASEPDWNAWGSSIASSVTLSAKQFAASILAARMDQKVLDAAPIWSDLLTFDARRWRGLVHIVSAGFPCQPWSIAGARKGKDDERWLWPDIARIIREVEPALCFLENVPGLVSGGGLEHVLFDLAALGFDAQWTHLAASGTDRAYYQAHLDGTWLTPTHG